MRDKYQDIIEDGDLVLIQTRKFEVEGQEMYEYSSYSESFIPCRKTVKLGNYELILRELEYDEVEESKIRRLDINTHYGK